MVSGTREKSRKCGRHLAFGLQSIQTQNQWEVDGPKDKETRDATCICFVIVCLLLRVKSRLYHHLRQDTCGRASLGSERS